MKFFQPTGACVSLGCRASLLAALRLTSSPCATEGPVLAQMRPLAMSALSPVWSTSGRNSDIRETMRMTHLRHGRLNAAQKHCSFLC